MKFLVLYLTGPLQSWGASSKFGERGTRDAPTKSGVLGLIAAACGIDRADNIWLGRVAEWPITVYAFANGRRLTDYHTIGARYDKKDSWQKRMIPTIAENGKPRGTDVTHRQYLTDSVFGVVLEGEDAIAEEMVRKLANPVWGVWLGRKSCIPTEPILVGAFNSHEEAQKALRERHGLHQRRHSIVNSEGDPDPISSEMFIVKEAVAGDEDEVLLDIPVSFARREFAARRICKELTSDGAS